MSLDTFKWRMLKACERLTLATRNVLLPKWRHPDRRVRLAAVSKLTSQHVLTRVAKRDPDDEVRELAVKKIADQDVLTEVLTSDSNSRVQLAAVGLMHPATLSKFVYSDCNSRARGFALEKITDQRILVDFVKAGSDCQTAAMTNLTDQAALSKLALTDRDDDVRYGAMLKLTDQNVLSEIARNDPTARVWEGAVGKLPDQKRLELVKTARKDVQLDAARRMKQITPEYEACLQIIRPHLMEIFHHAVMRMTISDITSVRQYAPGEQAWEKGTFVEMWRILVSEKKYEIGEIDRFKRTRNRLDRILLDASDSPAIRQREFLIKPPYCKAMVGEWISGFLGPHYGDNPTYLKITLAYDPSLAHYVYVFRIEEDGFLFQLRAESPESGYGGPSLASDLRGDW